ncbi:hypothetical protein D3C81_1225730 [compost metagenome]
MAFSLALPGFHFQLRQGDLFQAAAERTAQGKRAGRTIQSGGEVAEVLTIGVGDFAREGAQSDLRFVDFVVEPMPRKVLPVDVGLGAEAFTPVDATGEFQALFVVGCQIKAGDLRAAGVDFAFEQQRHWAFVGGQRGVAVELVTVFQVAFTRQQQLIELQGVGQVGARFERLASDAHLGWQVFRQRLQFTTQLAVEVTPAVGVQVEGFQQVAVDLQRQRPRPRARRRQCQITGDVQRPVAGRRECAGQVEAELVALQFHAVDLHALGGPVRRQLQTLELLAAVE